MDKTQKGYAIKKCANRERYRHGSTYRNLLLAKQAS
ncbi:hypothetical protein BBOR36S_00723 [Brevibacillus borstelensis]